MTFSREYVAQFLPPYQGHKNVHYWVGMGNNRDLQKQILKDFPLAVAQTANLALQFNTGDLETTAKKVWNQLRKELTYKEDNGFYQHIKSPSALNAIGSGDCKSYSEFAAGVMANLDYPIAFAFVSDYATSYPTHVFVIAGAPGNQVIIDGVYHKFNEEKTGWTYKKIIPMEIATITGLTGVHCNCGGNGTACGCPVAIGKLNLKKALQKAASNVKQAAKTAANAVKEGATEAAKKAAELVKKGVAMPHRTAFLQLVKLNAHAFAQRLNAHRQDALSRWKQIGGDPGELNASINAGMTRKAILGIGIGEPVTVTISALLAAAAPVLAALAVVLGKEPSPTTAPPTEKPPGAPNEPPTSPAPSPSDPGALTQITDLINSANQTLEAFNNATGKGSAPAPSGGSTPAPAPTESYPGAYYSGPATQPLKPEAYSAQEASEKSNWIPLALLGAALFL